MASIESRKEIHDGAEDVPFVDKKKNEGQTQWPHVEPVVVDENSDRVTVLESELTIPSREKDETRIPRPEEFPYFTQDKRFLETLEKVAIAVSMHDPCLLEGETAASKTSSIRYLAMLAKHEVVRMNLNGQTDTSELIGKFVPNDGSIQIEFEELLHHSELLSEGSRSILARANSEARSLSLVESQKIAQNENMKVPEWRWKDGLVPEAMRKGYWVILDEINLAEAQILERINSVLEKNPSLTLSENGGVKIGPGGNEEVSEEFRIFGTMNPAEYSGRQPMSPAYKDRWTSYKYVETPKEEDYRHLLTLMVYGEQPEVEIRGQKYRARDEESYLETLKEIPNFRGFLAKLAKFQSTVEDLARRREIGKNKKEKYIFTRRGLSEFMESLENRTVLNRATGEKITVRDNPKEIISRALQYYFLDKITDPDDLKKVRDQLDAIGIGSGKWTHVFAEAEKPVQKKQENKESREFRVGDKVKIINSVEVPQHNGEDGHILEITRDGKLRIKVGSCENHLFNPDGVKKLEEALPKPRSVAGYTGGGVIELTDKTESGIYKVNQKLKVKPGASLVSAITEAKKLKIVGFQSDGRVVAQIDDGGHFTCKVADMPENFEIISDSEKSHGEYVQIGGEAIEITEQKERGGFHVGEKLVLIGGVKARKEVANAKNIRVVGFTPKGEVVCQIDDGECILDVPEKMRRILSEATDDEFVEVEPESGTEEIPNDFIGMNGEKIKTTGLKEYQGLKIGQEVKLKTTDVNSKIRKAERLVIVGFDKVDNVVVQIDGDRVAVDDVESHKTFYEPKTSKENKDDATSERGKFKLGQKLRVKPGRESQFGLFAKNVLNAKKIEVVRINAGESGKGVTFELNDETVLFSDNPEEDFEIISET
ncbi:MAG: AAA family ATPase [bacterium]|nr:AAA family ATPase [bacterium]